MKITDHQKQLVKKYLRWELNYRETCEEFYDHILMAFESRPEGISLDDSLKSIINDDFGGIEGMRSIEKKYQRAIMKEMQKKYLRYAIDCLKFPLIGICWFIAL